METRWVHNVPHPAQRLSEELLTERNLERDQARVGEENSWQDLSGQQTLMSSLWERIKPSRTYRTVRGSVGGKRAHHRLMRSRSLRQSFQRDCRCLSDLLFWVFACFYSLNAERTPPPLKKKCLKLCFKVSVQIRRLGDRSSSRRHRLYPWRGGPA